MNHPERRSEIRNLDLDQLSPDKLFELACYVLNKPHHIRKEKDIQVLEKCTSNVKFFQDLVNENGPELHKQCCQHLDYQFRQAGEVVFNLGEIGKTFYITLKGSVGVWINLPKPPAEPGDPPEMVLTEVRVLPSGTAFGELALMSNKPRAATITAKEDTHFACLDKAPFDKILKETQEKKLMAQLQFFAKMKVFKGWNHSLLQKMFLQCFLVTFSRNQIIYQEGEASNNVYFVKSGEIRLSKTIDLAVDPSQANFYRFSKLYKFNNVVNSRTVDFAIISANELFGEEEVIKEINRQMTATVYSEKAELYMLSKKDFFRRVYSEESAKLFLQNHWEWKEKLYAKRTKEILATTENNKELLLQVSSAEIYRPIDYINPEAISKEPERVMVSPKKTPKKKRVDRIVAASPEQNNGKGVPSVFKNFGGVPKTTDELIQDLQPKMSAPIITFPTQVYEEVEQTEEYKALIVKTHRPRNYKEFTPEPNGRNRLVNFGRPRSLEKPNPLTQALKDQKTREQLLTQKKLAKRASLTAMRFNTMENVDRVDESGGEQRAKRGNSISGAQTHRESQIKRQIKIQGSLEPVERDPVRTITHMPIISADRAARREESPQEMRQTSGFTVIEGIENQRKEKMKVQIVKNLRRMLINDKVQAKAVNEFIEYSRRKSQSMRSTDHTTARDSNSIDKREQTDPSAKDSYAIQHRLIGFIMNRMDPRESKSQYYRHDRKSIGEKSAVEYQRTHSSHNVRSQPLITQKTQSNFYRVSTEGDASEPSEQFQRFHTEEQDRTEKTRTKPAFYNPPSGMNSTMQYFGTVSSLKQKHQLPFQKIHAFKTDLAQVKSFLDTKRLGTE